MISASLFWVSILAKAAPVGGPGPVTQALGNAVTIDWTQMQVEITAVSSGAGMRTLETAEQLALRAVEAGLRDAVPRIPLTATRVVGDLPPGSTRTAIEARAGRWMVTQTTYGASGRVAVVAVLSLQELLRPYAVGIAAVSSSAVTPSASGVVVDARGTGLRPVYVLTVVNEVGETLYDGVMTEEAAVSMPPYRFVTDPAHPLAAAAGPNPVLIVATGRRDGDLVVSVPDGVRLREGVGRSSVVVVVDE